MKRSKMIAVEKANKFVEKRHENLVNKDPLKRSPVKVRSVQSNMTLAKSAHRSDIKRALTD